jgi:glucose-1-phosphate thymidylyltransferase
MWGIVPAAGRGSRIQPLAFSKELLPVGSRRDGASDRPVAVSEYLIERMLVAGATKLCFVIAPGKSDILEYYGGHIEGADVCYVVQDRPSGLCDALFRALPFVGPDEWVLLGLPDTVWFPVDGLARLGDAALSFLLFPVDQPQLFDAVDLDELDNVREVEVKVEAPKSRWVWGAVKLHASALHELHALWQAREARDEYLGTLINAYLATGKVAKGFRLGRSYVDVGTLHGYREATRLLDGLR